MSCCVAMLSDFTLSVFMLSVVMLSVIILSVIIIIKRVSWFKSSLLLRIKTVDITNINS